MTSPDPRLTWGGLPVLIWTAGPDGMCDYVNDRWTEVTGQPSAELLGWGWTERLHPDDREALVAEYKGAVAAREPIRLEFRMLHEDGDYHWFLGLGEPCYRADGEFLGYSGCTTDVTDRRALEDRLAHVGRTGEIAQLAGGIAHDFNNLLTGILGHVTLLLDESALSLEAREDLAQIRHAADRAASLTRSLLSFSQRHAAAPRFLDLNQLVSGTLTAIRHVVGAPIEVSRELEDGLEPALADPGQLEQILLQLAAHARAAMPAGGELRLRTGRAQVDDAAVSRQPELRPGSYVTLEVHHTGELDTEALARVFDAPSATAGTSNARDLSAVPAIAKLSGGHVVAASAPGQGTTFTVYIPRLDAATEPMSDPDEIEAEGTETILLVEEDQQVREVGRRALERAGYSVLAVGDAESAIAAADRHPGHVHLLITDVVLPRVSGRELAARLAIHRPAIKVLYVSGTSEGPIARHRLLEPGIEFLEKPFSLEHLLRKARLALGAGLSIEPATSWTPRSLA